MTLRVPSVRQTLSAAVGVIYLCCLLLLFFMFKSGHKQTGEGVQWTEYYEDDAKPNLTSKILEVKVTADPQICDSLLETQSYLNKSDFRIQLIAATPGSGSDWCRTTISLLTGLKTHEVFDFMHEKNVDTVFKDGKYPIYYKSHYPFIKSHCAGDGYLHDHAERVIVVVRNPLDAALSEFIRQKMERRRGRNPDKYSQVETTMVRKDFLRNTSSGQSPSSRFDKYLDNYLKLWRQHHQYWLEDYTGELIFVLYDDLVKDINKFIPMVEFFGYDSQANDDRNYCFRENLKKTKEMKRPRVSLIADSKDKLRLLTSERIEESISYVKNLYYNKYKTFLNLN